jgi:hypothetical protein
MVVIDVFAKVRGIAPPSMNAHDADYAAMGRIKGLADTYGVAILLVHHVRKAGSDDFLATVSGTNGIAGAADAVLVLERGRNNADGVLHITGRDVEETDYAISFDPTDGTDHTIGDRRSRHPPTPTQPPRPTAQRHRSQNCFKRPTVMLADGDLDAEDVLLNCDNVLIGGNETTRHAITGVVHALATVPGLLDRVRDCGEHTEAVVEEVLRWTSPAMHVLRVATEEVTLNGRDLAPGTPVVAWLPAANRCCCGCWPGASHRSSCSTTRCGCGP